MRYFLSAGEPSGDLHAGNLARALRRADPAATVVGLGGDRLAAAGAELLHPLADTPIMGFVGAARAVPRMLRLLGRVEESWRRERPDAVVLIDYPGFHWHVAKAARKQGLPVVSFVPPQVWAWATWRVAWLRRSFDLVLCSLPFEEPWLRARGVTQARYVGHPFFDDLATRPERPAERAAVAPAAGRRVAALLPGSRGSEVRHNGDTLLDVARRLAPRHPDVEWHVAACRPAHAEALAARAAALGAPVRIHCGRTPEILAQAVAAVAVSGSVSLELMHHGVPTAFVYRIPAWWNWGPRQLLFRAEHIALPNLMAGRRLLPEFVAGHDPAAEAAAALGQWLSDEPRRRAAAEELAALRARYGQPGAVDAAAAAIVGMARGGGAPAGVARAA
jgi:lipid-A-disaccharide synthase